MPRSGASHLMTAERRGRTRNRSVTFRVFPRASAVPSLRSKKRPLRGSRSAGPFRVFLVFRGSPKALPPQEHRLALLDKGLGGLLVIVGLAAVDLVGRLDVEVLVH